MEVNFKVHSKIVVTLVSIILSSSMILMPAQNVNAYLNPSITGYNANTNIIADNSGIMGGKTTDEMEALKLNILENAEVYAVNTEITESPEYAKKPLPRHLNLSEQEIYALAKVVHGEARGESFTGQVAIAAVVINRINSDKFGKTVLEVIFEPGAFTAVADGQYHLEPDASAFKAVESALQGWDPTGGAIYYWNPHTATSKWVWSRPVINQIGKHVFAI